MRAVIALVIAAVIACVVALSAQTSKQVEEGKALFTKSGCAMCHQVAGKGNKMFPLDGVATKMKADQMKLWLTKPAEMEAKLPKPPALKMSSKKFSFSSSEVDSLLAYLQTLK